MRLSLTGDSILFRRLNSLADPRIKGLFDRIRACDVNFTNLELVANDHEGDPVLDHGGTHFGAPSWVLDELREAGFNLFAAATNHSLDYGTSGLRKMIRSLDERELVYAGIGVNLEEARQPAYLSTPSGTVALLSCTSTFARGQEAGAQTSLMAGRPGVSPLRFQRFFDVSHDMFHTLCGLHSALGLEAISNEKIRQGFSFPPQEGVLPFEGINFRKGSDTRIRTSANSEDREDILKWVEEAKMVSDVVVLSIHAHESDYNKAGSPDIEIPASFLTVFAHEAIEAGASIVVCHGPHLMRGIEIYRGKPIFHGLGNFIGQNELVSRLPMDSYKAFRFGPELTPFKLYNGRSENDTKGFPSDQRFWDSVVPICRFDQGRLLDIELMPVTLGLGAKPHIRGLPYVAEGADRDRVINELMRLSHPYGTSIKAQDDRISVLLERD